MRWWEGGTGSEHLAPRGIWVASSPCHWAVVLCTFHGSSIALSILSAMQPRRGSTVRGRRVLRRISVPRHGRRSTTRGHDSGLFARSWNSGVFFGENLSMIDQSFTAEPKMNEWGFKCFIFYVYGLSKTVAKVNNFQFSPSHTFVPCWLAPLFLSPKGKKNEYACLSPEMTHHPTWTFFYLRKTGVLYGCARLLITCAVVCMVQSPEGSGCRGKK